MPFKIKLEAVNTALENDRSYKIDYLSTLQVIVGSAILVLNLSILLFSSTFYKLDTKFLL